MFLPPNMLQIAITLYDKLDVAQKLPRNEKLGYKDHRKLSRHQATYSEMTFLLLEYIAPKASNELRNYLDNSQRFFCTLNSCAFETELREIEVLHAYWNCIFGPMLACLLHHFEDEKYEGNTIHSIAKLLISWKPHTDSSERAKWVKESIKQEYNCKTPHFTQLINDIHGKYVQSREIINKNLLTLEEELEKEKGSTQLNQEMRSKILSKISATYHATMVIKRLEENEISEYLIYIRNYLLQLQDKNNKSELLKLHMKICSTLLQSPNNIAFSWVDSPLIRKLDNYIVSEIKPSYPGFIEIFSKQNGDPCWPSPHKLPHTLSLIKYSGIRLQSPLEIALLNYYQMYHYVETGKFTLAYEYCKKVEEVSSEVHLGEYRSANLIHKIVLHWLINGQMLHNQFDTEITTLIMTLPDELTVIASIEPKFQKFYSSLYDDELMLLRSFSIFNAKHRFVKADPLKKLTEVINVAADICFNHQGDLNELLSIFKMKISKNILRSKSVLPFTKKLSLTDSLDMLPDLYSFVELKNSSTLDLFYKLHQHRQCRDLIMEFDKI